MDPSTSASSLVSIKKCFAMLEQAETTNKKYSNGFAMLEPCQNHSNLSQLLEHMLKSHLAYSVKSVSTHPSEMSHFFSLAVLAWLTTKNHQYQQVT